MLELTSLQTAVVEAGQSSFLLGPAGTGKTTALRHRLIHLLTSGEPAYTLLVLVAEPEHVLSFQESVRLSGLEAHADLEITTYSQMARGLITLFWPLVARPAGFTHAYRPPTFLGYDLAQLLMWQTITPMVAEGAFAGLPLRKQQIVSQILDTLNRAALNTLTLDEAFARQINAWSGSPDHLQHLQDAATAGGRFRHHCLANGLLDLSLVVEVFDTQVVNHPEFRKYFSERFRHLLVDNIEEQAPAGQNFVASLMDATETTAIAFDQGGGYKRFLAADPAGAKRLRSHCANAFEFDTAHSFTFSGGLAHLSNAVENFLLNSKQPTADAPESIVVVVGGRYRREMVANLISQLKGMLSEEIVPHDIAVITPYLDGALRYSLEQEFKSAKIPYVILRRRSSPREEPRVRAWLTWLALAHLDWELRPSPYDIAEALDLSIAGLDPARAALVARTLYDSSGPALLPTSELPDKMTGRVGQELVTLVEDLRMWLAEHGGGRYHLDLFLHRLFSSLLALPPFQPEPDLVGAAVCDWLVRTASRLRQAAIPMGLKTPREIGRAFVDGIQQGLVTAGPPDFGDPPDPNGVLISTLYGYLLAGYPVRYQVWLETAASGWWDIPRQPLSNAFVLTWDWPARQQWTMEDDFNIRNQLLSGIVRGLTARCTGGIILASSDLDRRGIRQEGPLWRALQPILGRSRQGDLG